MYLTHRFYIITISIIGVYTLGYAISVAFYAANILLLLLTLGVITDTVWLYHKRTPVTAYRTCSERLSNGDDNEILISVENHFAHSIKAGIIDEIPAQFQRRDLYFPTQLKPNEHCTIRYNLRPTERGTYQFGHIIVFISSLLALVERKVVCDNECTIKVYPSFLMLRQYEFLAINNNLTEMGIKRIRRIGNHTEFEQIKDYVVNDDFRTINWKASARRHSLMVNVYQDERSQQIYNIIDKGRVMQHAFNGMSLLDYAINASLVLSYVAINKSDKAGLITFSDKTDTFVPADRRINQLQQLQEALYQEKSNFMETDFSALCVAVNKYISKRSLLVVYTNFFGYKSLERQLPFLQQLNNRHRVLLVFFDDSELKEYVSQLIKDSEEECQHLIAEKYIYEKKLIVSQLKQYGIHTVLTTPDKLSVDVINKYLEMKSRQLLG